MGILTWIVVGIVVLAIVGLGPRVFFSGITKGIQKIGSDPAVKKAAEQGKEGLESILKNIISATTGQNGNRHIMSQEQLF